MWNEIQLHVSIVKDLCEAVAPVQNGDGKTAGYVKPRYGLWTSTWIPEYMTSAWVQWCEQNYTEPIKDKSWYLLTPRSESHVAVIDSLQDLLALLKEYCRQDERKISSLLSRYLDFERLSQNYDAVHLTERGQRQTRLTLKADLYGWDCESTLWFRWCFKSIERMEVPSMHPS